MLTTQDIWNSAESTQGNVAAEIRVMLGEAALAESLFDDAQRSRRIEAMQKCAAESTGDVERHDAWMKMHVDAGWVYGETFDPVAKTHPNLKPWDELPPTVKSKARIFDIFSKSFAALSVKLLEKDLGVSGTPYSTVDDSRESSTVEYATLPSSDLAIAGALADARRSIESRRDKNPEGYDRVHAYLTKASIALNRVIEAST